jgi:hypothetical protein
MQDLQPGLSIGLHSAPREPFYVATIKPYQTLASLARHYHNYISSDKTFLDSHLQAIRPKRTEMILLQIALIICGFSGAGIVFHKVESLIAGLGEKEYQKGFRNGMTEATSRWKEYEKEIEERVNLNEKDFEKQLRQIREQALEFIKKKFRDGYSAGYENGHKDGYVDGQEDLKNGDVVEEENPTAQ